MQLTGSVAFGNLRLVVATVDDSVCVEVQRHHGSWLVVVEHVERLATGDAVLDYLVRVAPVERLVALVVRAWATLQCERAAARVIDVAMIETHLDLEMLS